MNRPISLVCYICGREFGTKSLAIHVKACIKKWDNEQSLKPPKQRRPCPQPPKGFNQLVSKGNISKEDINKFNTGSFGTFVEEALMECQYCGRKFNPKSLAPHQKACKINPMIKKPYVSKAQLEAKEANSPAIKVPTKSYEIPDTQGYPQEQKLVPCRKCGRNFNSNRVAKHQKICKGEEVKKVKGISQKYEPQPSKKPKPKTGQKAEKWKVQSNELRSAMKAMREMKAYQAKGGKISDLPPPPRSNYDHYIECKYCGRKYAPDVAERHIPKCASIVNKPGGIKPSKIQEKYIAGTGASKGLSEKKPAVVVGSTGKKPAAMGAYRR